MSSTSSTPHGHVLVRDVERLAPASFHGRHIRHAGRRPGRKRMRVNPILQPINIPYAVAPKRLLAVRKAGATFDSIFNLRSARFDALLKEREMLRAELADVRRTLLTRLYEAVPRAADQRTRRQLVQIKRNIFNERLVTGSVPAVANELAQAIETYNSLRQREREILEVHRLEIVAEYRQRIEVLLRNERFRMACLYASPGIFESLEHGRDLPEDRLSALDRGLYAYATKFISKANPFHAFAEVSFPPTAGVTADGQHEIVIDLSAVLRLEQLLLPLADSRTTWVCLRPYFRESGTCNFWLSGPTRLVPLRDHRVLQLAVRFFEEQIRRHERPVGTRADYEAYVLSQIPSHLHDSAKRLLSKLVEQGVVVEYLVTDLGRFAPPLLGISDECDPALKLLQQHHLARVPTHDLPRVHDEISKADQLVSGTSPIRYWLNSYNSEDTTPHEHAAEELYNDLSDLKACFGMEHNFVGHDYVFRAFILEYLETRGVSCAPYLEVLRDYLRSKMEIVNRYLPEVHRTPDDRNRHAQWRAQLAAEIGQLSRKRLEELSGYPRSHGIRRSLCFNGPFDYLRRIYYVSNVFAGDGHFISRYLLHRQTAADVIPRDGESIDVELATPSWRNLNYVVRHCDVGCGFEARYAHRYRRWIDPSEIAIELRSGQVVYRHASSGAILRIHYRGFLLSQMLPSEYQLLLLGHADTFHNPFRRTDTLTGGCALRHDPGLYYGAICVRREQWVSQKAVLADLGREQDELQFAVLLREWVHQHLREGADEWYFMAVDPRAKRRKPRFLDLRNPLSAFAFRRVVTASSWDGLVSFTVMEPPIANLFRAEGAPSVTELMIEV